jgi:hypothetical protein
LHQEFGDDEIGACLDSLQRLQADGLGIQGKHQRHPGFKPVCRQYQEHFLADHGHIEQQGFGLQTNDIGPEGTRRSRYIRSMVSPIAAAGVPSKKRKVVVNAGLEICRGELPPITMGELSGLRFEDAPATAQGRIVATKTARRVVMHGASSCPDTMPDRGSRLVPARRAERRG